MIFPLIQQMNFCTLLLPNIGTTNSLITDTTDRYGPIITVSGGGGGVGGDFKFSHTEKGSNWCVQSVNACDAGTSTDLTWLEQRFEVVVVLSAAGRFRWCGLRPRLGALMTVSVPSVDAAYSAESTVSDIFRENSRKVITRLAICRENFHWF